MVHHSGYHHRRSIRLRDHDYASPGAYYVTICTQNSEHFFGNIVDQKMILNDAGKMVEAVWGNLAIRFGHLTLDEFVIMPNHLHGIIIINPHTIFRNPIYDVVGAFKSETTHKYLTHIRCSGWPHFCKRLWQRNYYEHVVRNNASLTRIREYIARNPQNWKPKSP